MNIKKFFTWFIIMLITAGGICLNRQCYAIDNPKSWMSQIFDKTKICEMNIPGTHDSGTKKTTIFTEAFASCQSDSISEQLNKGIRYLDIRINSDLLVNHGGVSCYKSTFYGLYLCHVLDDVSKFLEENPSETVIIQLKEEGDGKGDFDENVNDEISKRSNIYLPWNNPSELTLSDVRGKIVLFTRSGNIYKAYNYDRWADNCACWQINIGNSSAILQDSYTDKSVGEKMNHIRDFYKTVWEGYPFKGLFYINFTSCMGGGVPKLISKNINKSFKSFVNENRGKKLGIVLMDNPDSSLIHDIYSSNYSF